MRQVLPIVATVSVTVACQQANVIRLQPETKKNTACAESKNLTADDLGTRWERSPKTFTHTDLFLHETQRFFSLFGGLSDYRAEYEKLWSTLELRSDKIFEVDKHVGRLLIGLSRYQIVSITQGVPWWYIGIIHGLEGGYNFSTHLHNGDSLSARTTHIPSGRPQTGTPPFLWEESAKDAIKVGPTPVNNNWKDPAAIAYAFESYNGLGYHSQNISSPYLWSFSNHYTKGKYVADGQYDASAVSSQAGAMVILKQAINRGIVNINNANSVPSQQVLQQYQQKYGTLPPLAGTSSDCAR
jgi:lysozyme family protein